MPYSGIIYLFYYLIIYFNHEIYKWALSVAIVKYSNIIIYKYNFFIFLIEHIQATPPVVVVALDVIVPLASRYHERITYLTFIHIWSLYVKHIVIKYFSYKLTSDRSVVGSSPTTCGTILGNDFSGFPRVVALIFTWLECR